MTETFRATKNYKVDHSKFGGIIYPSDYNTEYRGNDNVKGSIIASRIIKDQIFDTQCQKNADFRNRKINKSNQDKI